MRRLSEIQQLNVIPRIYLTAARIRKKMTLGSMAKKEDDPRIDERSMAKKRHAGHLGELTPHGHEFAKRVDA